VVALIDVHIYVHVLLTLINASVSKRSYLVLCLPSTAHTEERAGGGGGGRHAFFSKTYSVKLNLNIAHFFI